MVIKSGSILNHGSFSTQLTRSDNLDHFDLATAKEREVIASVCCAVSWKTFENETALTALTPKKPVTLLAESINLWHRWLEHPNQAVLVKLRGT